MKGNSTCVMPMTTPAVVPRNDWPPVNEATIPLSCNRIIHANVRTISDVQNGKRAMSVNAALARGPLTSIR